jgi:hypothetical protein
LQRCGERRKIGRPARVSFVVRSRAEGFDPEGSRDPGGEPKFEDESQIPRSGWATGTVRGSCPVRPEKGRAGTGVRRRTGRIRSGDRFEDVGQERRPGRGDLPQGRPSLQESERLHREANFYRNGERTSTKATIRSWINQLRGAKGLRHIRTGCHVQAVHAGRRASDPTGHLEPFFSARPRLRATPGDGLPVLVALLRVCLGEANHPSLILEC